MCIRDSLDRRPGGERRGAGHQAGEQGEGVAQDAAHQADHEVEEDDPPEGAVGQPHAPAEGGHRREPLQDDGLDAEAHPDVREEKVDEPGEEQQEHHRDGGRATPRYRDQEDKRGDDHERTEPDPQLEQHITDQPADAMPRRAERGTHAGGPVQVLVTHHPDHRSLGQGQQQQVVGEREGEDDDLGGQHGSQRVEGGCRGGRLGSRGVGEDGPERGLLKEELDGEIGQLEEGGDRQDDQERCV